MVDICIIERQTGSTTSALGVVTEIWTQIYPDPDDEDAVGICELQERGGYPRDVNTAPDQPQLAVARELKLPIATSAAVRANDRATMVSSAHDPAAVGRRFWLRAQPAKSHATARRFHTEEIAG